ELRHVFSWLAAVAALQGKFSEAEQWLSQAQQIVDRLASPEPRAYLTFARGGLAHLRGNDSGAEAHLQDALAEFRAIGPGSLVWSLGILGVVQAAQGKGIEANATLDEIQALLTALPAESASPGEPLAYFAQTALLLADPERLAWVYPKLLGLAGRFPDLLVDRLLGEIEIARGDQAAAEAHLAAAETLARREELLPELVLTLAARARLVPGQGHREAAKRSSSRSARLPAALSAREAEVLRLVARGKSNRAIAEELVLSEKTVENHLRNIYGKIGAENRATATAFAVRQGLA
ncbi:MAG TPA: response regulator transcription factor, partial [Chloroflexota bacterium]|nr:response regulator transcription factor [Chloroflexota bacterium]